jgi:hypothetical protein
VIKAILVLFLFTSGFCTTCETAMESETANRNLVKIKDSFQTFLNGFYSDGIGSESPTIVIVDSAGSTGFDGTDCIIIDAKYVAKKYRSVYADSIKNGNEVTYHAIIGAISHEYGHYLQARIGYKEGPITRQEQELLSDFIGGYVLYKYMWKGFAAECQAGNVFKIFPWNAYLNKIGAFIICSYEYFKEFRFGTVLRHCDNGINHPPGKVRAKAFDDGIDAARMSRVCRNNSNGESEDSPDHDLLDTSNSGPKIKAMTCADDPKYSIINSYFRFIETMRIGFLEPSSR